MTEICTLCGSALFRKKFSARDFLSAKGGVYPVHECRKCGLLYTAGVENRTSFRYPDSYYSRMADERVPGAQPLKNLYASRLRSLRQFRRGGKILDVGCGDGSFLGALREAGWEAFGTEIHCSVVNAAKRQGLPIFEGELGDIRFPPDHFDFITYFGSFEHVGSPKQELEEVKRVLKKNGLLLISLTDAGSLEAKVFGPHWFGYEVPRHRYNYTRQSLHLLLTKTGLKCLKMESQRNDFITSFSLACSLGLESKYRLLRRPLQWLLRPVKLLTRAFDPGNVIEMVASPQ